jgi:hypothetical protein
MSPDTKETVMNRDLLKECIAALKELRARKHHELEASVVAELDAAILQLESCWRRGGETVHVPANLRVRTLNVMVESLKLLTNLSTLIRTFFGPK